MMKKLEIPSRKVQRKAGNVARKTLQQKLVEQKTELERSVLATVRQGREPEMENRIDPADQAVMSYQQELIFSQGTNKHTQLSLVRLALERLEDGSYGECAECGEDISPRRLEAVPWTPYCISCQEKVENGGFEGGSRAA
ncbi:MULTISPECIES: TraR/DksA family transcriptional regulator [Acidobacterium]|uniref:Putative RNA polymerase-binding protein DksA n=1 Tax=Acidobacterium capsulatum (strain ATCC 51196 / DSM 11244 / BCRC 80197 / JCM 7670 / NBRC 15755 / NCIMB 13165 / 161) TaxID=240015 RepID=C1F3S7_ACIC5|nr:MULTISPECIES: TraR/DksA family transcriptional regulator [Acidobacterium]ACO31482.1 putative RNA polymerase-binding protein DksA [Acidobacterium capsulatum ATCC 51196]